MNTATHAQITAKLPHALKRRLFAALALRGESYTHWLAHAALVYLRQCDEDEKRLVAQLSHQEKPQGMQGELSLHKQHIGHAKNNVLS